MSPSCEKQLFDDRAKRDAENEAITFNASSFSSFRQIAARFNQQFNTSKLGRHTSSSDTRLEMVQTFICRNIKSFCPDKLSIFNLKHLGPRAIQYITALFNLSVTTCQIPWIWKYSLIIPIPKRGRNTSVRTSYRPISLLCPVVKELESLNLPTINKCLQHAPDQQGLRPDHLTASALLQMTTDIAMGLNQRKPPDRTICVAVDFSSAFDTVCHNKINISHPPRP